MNTCAHCRGKITGGMVKSGNKTYHPQCFNIVNHERQRRRDKEIKEAHTEQGRPGWK